MQPAAAFSRWIHGLIHFGVLYIFLKKVYKIMVFLSKEEIFIGHYSNATNLRFFNETEGRKKKEFGKLHATG